MASAVGALWAARYGKAYRGITLRSGPDAELPDPVVKQMEREGVRETSAVEPADEAPRGPAGRGSDGERKGYGRRAQQRRRAGRAREG